MTSPSAHDSTTFWRLDHPQASPALIDAASGHATSYGELRTLADASADDLAATPPRALGFVLATNDTPTVARYLAALRRGHVVALLDARLAPALLARLLDAYRPDWVSGPTGGAPPSGYSPTASSAGDDLFVRSEPTGGALHPDLALLLSTSGTTGSPKMVRLASTAVAANAASIARYLDLTDLERPITTLPLHYSYGLSVLNSHLAAGACVVLTGESVARRELWAAVDRHGVTSISGVPYTYQMLARLRFDAMALPSLRTLTQAGGRLDPALVRQFGESAAARGRRFFVMYGQTEAVARMSYVPPEALLDHVGSVGIAIPGGALDIDEATSELSYRGPNVMLGYGESLADLAAGDELAGVLRTGDLARRDADGFVWLSGRTKRFVKLFGLRVSLDEVEQLAQEVSPSPVACVGEDDALVVAVEDPGHEAAIVESIATTFGIHRSALRAAAIGPLDRLTTGKLDYGRIRERVGL